MIEIYKNKSLKSLPNEIWKDIPGMEGLYQVSSMGRFKSLYKKATRSRNGKDNSFFIKEYIVSQHLHPQGYLNLKMTNPGTQLNFRSHRVVGLVFVPNQNNLPEINHKRGVKTDNRATELEWTTRSGNIKHAFDTGLKTSKFQNFGAGNPKSKPVSQFTRDGVFIKTFPGQAQAMRETGIDASLIWHTCNGKYPHGGGFLWKYAEGFGLGERGASRTSIKAK